MAGEVAGPELSGTGVSPMVACMMASQSTSEMGAGTAARGAEQVTAYGRDPGFVTCLGSRKSISIHTLLAGQLRPTW